MKGIRFYLDHDSPQHKRRGEHSGNVTAVFVDNDPFWTQYGDKMHAQYDALGAVYFVPDSPVAGTSAAISWMHTCGKRISEAKARQIHPQLFKRLDTFD